MLHEITVAVVEGHRGDLPRRARAHHRDHHRYSDTPRDIHSPLHGGALWSHAGWILSPHFAKTRLEAVPDLAAFPELVWLDRRHWLAPVALGLLCGAFGAQILVWGFFVSTTLLYHGTFTVNSLAHLFGSQPFDTSDDSRNNALVAALTLGEGWHNNHHRYPGATKQGIAPHELDLAWWGLRVLSAAGLVWDLKETPYEETSRHTRRPARGLLEPAA